MLFGARGQDRIKTDFNAGEPGLGPETGQRFFPRLVIPGPKLTRFVGLQNWFQKRFNLRSIKVI